MNKHNKLYLKPGEIDLSGLAKLCGVSDRTIRNWHKYGWIKPVFWKWGVATVFRLDDVKVAVVKHRLGVSDEARAVLGLEQTAA